MVCQLTTTEFCAQPHSAVFSCAEGMAPPQRRQLALDTLAGMQTVSRLAQEHHVSRKFVYQQAAKAEEALDKAFSPTGLGEAEVLFHLPVTKAWLRQVALGLTLT